MSLEIHVVKASNLQNLENFGKSDPYVTVDFQGEKKKTEVKSGTLDPEWDETLKWELGSKAPRADGCIDITVKDYERIGRNKVLGKATIALRNLIHATPGTPIDYELGLLDAQDSPTVGTLTLKVSYNPPAGAAGAVSGGPTVGAMAARSAAVTSELADGEGQSIGGADLPNGFPATEDAKAAESSGRKRDKVKAGLKRIMGHKAKATNESSK